jgi:hypothetical protein
MVWKKEDHISVILFDGAAPEAPETYVLLNCYGIGVIVETEFGLIF